MDKSPSTIPSKVIDVELPDESGAKYIVVLLLIVDATISIPVDALKSSRSYPTGISDAKITNLSLSWSNPDIVTGPSLP